MDCNPANDIDKKISFILFLRKYCRKVDLNDLNADVYMS